MVAPAFHEPRDVGEACLFLASPLASYMSGANLLLHGGGLNIESELDVGTHITVDLARNAPEPESD